MKSDLSTATSGDLESTYALILQDGFILEMGERGLTERIRNGEIYLLKPQDNLIGVGFVSPLKRTPRLCRYRHDYRWQVSNAGIRCSIGEAAGSNQLGKRTGPYRLDFAPKYRLTQDP
jgi:hypothetical protein